HRIRAQLRGERIAHGVGVPFLTKIDMRHLADGVHAGVGASGALHRDLFAGEGFNRRRQHALHRGRAGLNLPAGKGRAVVFDKELVAGHQHNLVPAGIAVPRKNSSVAIGCLPARFNSTSRTAPSPQATVSLSSSTVPAAPDPSPRVERSTFTRTGPFSPASSNQAPGNGDRPRM